MPVQITPHKRCGMCGETKDRARDFSPNGKYVATYCKPCMAGRAAVWRESNPGHAVKWRRKDRKRNPKKHRERERERYAKSIGVQLAIAARSEPCVDCGIQLPPQVMELDHVRGEKLFTLGGPMLSRRPEAEVRAEIAKCDVRCPNCHRLRHHYEREARKAA